MNPTYKILITVIISVFSISGMIAQDIIIKKDGSKIKAKIIEITDTQIRYNEFRDINDLIFTMDRALIREIRFESGTKYKEERPGTDAAYFADDRISNLKINFFSIGDGNLILTYERAIDPGSSWEATLKVYGIGDGTAEFSDNDSGFGFYGGYKFKLGNIFKKSSEYRPKHILHGGYFRPVLGYSYSRTDFEFRSNRSFEKDSYVHFGLDIGKQWIIRNAIALDLSIGFHYYGGSFTSDDPNADIFNISNSINDGDLTGAENRAVSFGFKVGGLFSKQGIDKKKTR